MQQLGEAWARARQGQRQVVWVTGEAGIGKTAVVEAFRAAVATDPTVWLVAGQCVEHYGKQSQVLKTEERRAIFGQPSQHCAAHVCPEILVWLAAAAEGCGEDHTREQHGSEHQQA